MTFDADRTHVRRVDLTTVDDLSASLPLRQRIQTAVRHTPMTIASLAEELGAKVDTIKKTVDRYPRLFSKISGTDGINRIALTEGRTA
jgi:hypothetical protein